MANDTAERRAKLEARLKQIEDRLRKLDAREAEKERKRDTRRKIIVGAIAWEHAKRDENFKALLLPILDKYTDKTADRELLELPVRVETDGKH